MFTSWTSNCGKHGTKSCTTLTKWNWETFRNRRGRDLRITFATQPTSSRRPALLRTTSWHNTLEGPFISKTMAALYLHDKDLNVTGWWEKATTFDDIFLPTIIHRQVKYSEYLTVAYGPHGMAAVGYNLGSWQNITGGINLIIYWCTSSPQ